MSTLALSKISLKIKTADTQKNFNKDGVPEYQQIVANLRDKFSVVSLRDFLPSCNIEIYFCIILANFHFHSITLPREFIFSRY